MTERLEPQARHAGNRYFADSPVYPGRFARDWNRSYVMQPEGTPAGAVVLLHGLTDSPYSLRHIAQRYLESGYVAVAIRMPGHGTRAPGGWLPSSGSNGPRPRAWPSGKHADWPALRCPCIWIGFSNGGALAMKYALKPPADKALRAPDRIVLIAPMIGITSLARFVGVMGWPAVFPAFAKGGLAGRGAGVQPVQVQSVPGQRRAPELAGGARYSRTSPNLPARAGSANWRPCSRSSRWWTSPSARVRSSTPST
ncbi:MAG: alpha/beta hydrolase [Betaproteobacteria bacterium]|nr:alpha/beta hydrolase [Betaproteobacteria bacterium]